MIEVSSVQLNSSTAPARGVSPEILLTQVRNTAPFLFENQNQINAPYARILNAWQGQALTHLDYFKLCLAAHHATVATFVPTDVDNQIRFKLWSPQLDTSTLLSMTEAVIESRDWDCTPVSTRVVRSPVPGPILSGHLGEWFSTAVGAYAALRKRAPDSASDVAAEIVREVQRHARIFEALEKARDGIGLLKAATLIAHNLGDLDRVFEMWNIPDEDPLKSAVFKAGHLQSSYGRALQRAGQLNKAAMAVENHRHFALRGPRCLRRNADFLLPIAPFLDAWGSKLARHPRLEPEEIGEIVEALFSGWEYLRKNAKNGETPVGYARAVAGILDSFPGGMSELKHYLPAKTAREIKAGPFRAQSGVSRERFEQKWNQIAL